MPDASLPRARILRHRNDFEAVRRQGRRVASRHLALNFLRAADRERQAGFIVPKACGNAVRRNQIKRRLREIYRHHQHALTVDLWSVWIARRGAADATFAELQNEMLALYARAGLETTA
ncbi:MAG: ribonuclease P protein component [Verrucomicrobiales bacterium]|jgi:ribonuclease P protein component|nr:ribonuclease P protein component [Verrucomicrobiales bacterium]MDR1305754.1 ribonuclease P protein component [Verrucomicrobiales bacterium]